MSKGMLGLIPLSEIQGPMNDLMDKLAGADGPKVFADLKKFLRGELSASVVAMRTYAKGQTLFAPRADVSLVSNGIDPDTYYRDRPGLYVWDDYRSRVVAKARRATVGTPFNIGSADLLKAATDEEIEAALPVNHLFDESEICAIVEAMIAAQSNGEAGELLNNGCANLFYLSSCVVGVGWYSGGRYWYVDTWRRDDRGWGAGYRVFSR